MAMKAEIRLPLFDELRGLAIIGVIAIHSAVHTVEDISTPFDYWLLVVQTMIFRFAVPSFLIISGFFVSFKEQASQSVGMKHSMIRRIQRVIFPYIIWSSLYFLLFLFVGVQYSRNPAIIFFEQLLTGSVVLHLYFLVLIIQMYVLSYFGLMENGSIGKVTTILVVTAFLIFTIPSYFLSIGTGGFTGMWARAGYYFTAFERSLFPRWLLFFMFGRWLGIHWTSVKDFSMRHWRLLSFSVVASLILCVFDFYYVRLWSGNMHLLPPDWMISCFFFGSLFTIWFLTLPVQANFVFEWLGKLGGVSFGVYLLHEPLLSMAMRSTYWHSFSGVLPNAFLRQCAAITMGLGASLILLSVLQRVLPTRVKRYVLG